MHKLLSAGCLGLAMFCSSCHGHAVSREERWQEDFSTLDRQFVRRQIDTFGRITQNQWQEGISQLRALPIRDRTDAEIALQIEHLLALYHDGHIKILPDSSTAEPDYLPVKFRWFPSGIYVTNAADPALRGARLLRLGSVDAGSLLERIAPWISVENEPGLRAAASSSLWNAAVLAAAEIADPRKPVPMLVRLVSGEQTIALLNPQPFRALHWSTPGNIPAYRQQRTPPNWLAIMPEQNAVYLRFAECHDKQRSRALAAELESAVQHGARRVIIDLRGNQGGDSAAFAPILDFLKTRPSNIPRLIALTDRETFSSAFRNAVELRQIGATLVGEAPSQRPVYTGNVESFLLPNSHLQIRYTTKWSRLGPADQLEMTPDIPKQPTAEQYFQGEDPVLDAALKVT